MRIERLRATSEKFMSSTLGITRYVYPVDEQGVPLTDRYGDPLEPTAETATTKCKLRSTSGDESIVAGQLQESAEALIKCPVGTDIRSSDEVYVDGVKFNVVYVKMKSEALSAHVEALISRVSG